MRKQKTLTTGAGAPVGDNQNSLTVGPRGPVLMQDLLLAEKMAHFNRERIPERVVHAKGSGAHGTFEVTADITRWSKARVFERLGKKTEVFVRFSTVGGEKGSGDTERDPRGFAVKFYTEEGNWDMVGNNTPVFFVRDPLKFSDFIHTQKRDPHTNLKSPTMMWDFWSLSPESLHQVTILFSDRGTPRGYRHMNGYSSHTFSLINEEGLRVWCKWHFKTMQGIHNFHREEALEMLARDPDFAQRDLFEAIDRSEHPRWRICVQIMEEHQVSVFRHNSFDLTKVWPQEHIRFDDNGGRGPNYEPNSFGGPAEDPRYRDVSWDIGSYPVERYDHRLGNDDFTQAGDLFRLLAADAQQRLIHNVVMSIKGVPPDIQVRQLQHFFKADPVYGRGIAEGLGYDQKAILELEVLSEVTR
jgi:catalase